MPLVTFAAGEVIRSADVNGNFSIAMLTDTSRTVSVTHTYTASQTFTGGWTSAAGCLISAGGLTIVSGGLTVSLGGVTATGTSTFIGPVIGTATLAIAGETTLGSGLNAATGVQLRLGSLSVAGSVGTTVSDGAIALGANAFQTGGTGSSSDSWTQSNTGNPSGLLTVQDSKLAYYSRALGASPGTLSAFWGTPLFSVASGILLLGTTVATGAATGEAVLQNAKSYRGLNAAGSSSKSLIRLNASDKVSIDSDALGALFGGSVAFSTALSKIIPGATSLTFRNNADTQDNLAIVDAGDVTIGRGNLTLSLGNFIITGIAGTVQIGGNQVIGPRLTGYTNAWTGAAANKATGYDASSITLPQLAARVRALQESLTTHGLIAA